MNMKILNLLAVLCFFSLGVIGCNKRSNTDAVSTAPGAAAATAPATQKLIPDECQYATISGMSLNRGGYTYDDPPIQALINQGSYKIQKITSEVTSRGTLVCNAFLSVSGIYNGNSYSRDVTVWAYPPK